MFRKTEIFRTLDFAARRARFLRRTRFFDFRAAIVGAVHSLFSQPIGPNHEFPCFGITEKDASHCTNDLIGTPLRNSKHPRSVMRGRRIAVIYSNRMVRHGLIINSEVKHTAYPLVPVASS
jgi:hypothetical protein